jgi:hypothetical protein
MAAVSREARHDATLMTLLHLRLDETVRWTVEGENKTARYDA